MLCTVGVCGFDQLLQDKCNSLQARTQEVVTTDIPVHEAVLVSWHTEPMCVVSEVTAVVGVRNNGVE